MLKRILDKLNGSGGDPAALELALAQLHTEQQDARAALVDAQQKRRQALLDDESDATLEKLERLLARAEVRCEKADTAEPVLQQRLTEARIVAHRAAVKKHAALIVEHYEKHLRPAVLAAENAQLSMRILRENAAREVGEHALNSAVPPLVFGGILGTGFAAGWVAEMDRLVAMARGATTAPAPSLPAPRRQPPKQLDNGNGPVSLHVNPTPPARQARPADDMSPLEPGEARVKVARNGFSPSNDAPQAHAGQIVKMPAALAQQAADRGAVAIIEVQR